MVGKPRGPSWKTIKRRPKMTAFRRKRINVNRSAIGKVMPVHRFIRRSGLCASQVGAPPTTVSTISVTATTSPAISYGWLGCSLSAMSGVTDFSNLFDQYRLNNFTITFSTRYSGTSPTTPFSGTLYTCIDTNDATVPSSINQLREYQNCKIHYLNNKDKRTCSVSFRPKVSMTGSDLSGLTVQPILSPWINFTTAGINMSYYGIKYALVIDDLVQTPPIELILDIETKYDISCKNVQ